VNVSRAIALATHTKDGRDALRLIIRRIMPLTRYGEEFFMERARKDLVDALVNKHNPEFIEALPGETPEDALRRLERESILIGEIKALRVRAAGLEAQIERQSEFIVNRDYDTDEIAARIAKHVARRILGGLQDLLSSEYKEDD
jgi:hypothetical protein